MCLSKLFSVYTFRIGHVYFLFMYFFIFQCERSSNRRVVFTMSFEEIVQLELSAAFKTVCCLQVVGFLIFETFTRERVG